MKDFAKTVSWVLAILLMAIGWNATELELAACRAELTAAEALAIREVAFADSVCLAHIEICDSTWASWYALALDGKDRHGRQVVSP